MALPTDWCTRARVCCGAPRSPPTAAESSSVNSGVASGISPRPGWQTARPNGSATPPTSMRPTPATPPTAPDCCSPAGSRNRTAANSSPVIWLIRICSGSPRRVPRHSRATGNRSRWRIPRSTLRIPPPRPMRIRSTMIQHHATTTHLSLHRRFRTPGMATAMTHRRPEAMARHHNRTITPGIRCAIARPQDSP